MTILTALRVCHAKESPCVLDFEVIANPVQAVLRGAELGISLLMVHPSLAENSRGQDSCRRPGPFCAKYRDVHGVLFSPFRCLLLLLTRSVQDAKGTSNRVLLCLISIHLV